MEGGLQMDLSTAIRKRIINLCTEKNMNVNQLAIKSGINPSTIRSIIKSRCNTPTTQTIYYLCIGFGISLKDFYNSKIFDNLDDN